MKKSELKALIREVVSEVELQNEKLNFSRAIRNPRAAVRAFQARDMLNKLFNRGKTPPPEEKLTPLSTRDLETLRDKLQYDKGSAAQDYAARRNPSNPSNQDYIDADEKDPLSRQYAAGADLMHNNIIDRHQTLMKKILGTSNLKIKFSLADWKDKKLIDGEMIYLHLPESRIPRLQYKGKQDFVPIPNLYVRYYAEATDMSTGKTGIYSYSVGFTLNSSKYYLANQHQVESDSHRDNPVKFGSPQDEEKIKNVLLGVMAMNNEI